MSLAAIVAFGPSCIAASMGGLYKAKPACLAAVPGTKECERFDKIEQFLATFDQKVDMPITHRFTPHMYIREIFMPKGFYVTSRIHLTEHPFTISKGKVRVKIGETEWITLQAPHTGITLAGTRRLLETIEDCVWTTYHVTDETDPDKLVDLLYADHYDHISHVRDFKDNTNSTQVFANEDRVVAPTFDKSITNPDKKTLEEPKP